MRGKMTTHFVVVFSTEKIGSFIFSSTNSSIFSIFWGNLAFF
jgi:hypothetical protein